MMKRLAVFWFVFTTMAVRAAELPSVAVADFTSDERWWHTGLTHGLPDMIADGLVNSKRFDVYERTKLATVMKEQGFQASGFADPQTAVALGKLAGVRYIVTGQIIDYGRETRDFAGYGFSTRTSFYRMKAGIKVIETQTGKVIFSRNDGAEQKLDEGRAMHTVDTTMDTKLAEEVSGKLIKALLEDDSFKAPGETKVALVAVKVTSEPERGDVEVDGVFYGNAGGDVKIPSGLHLVTVGLPGYETWSKKVQVQEGMSIHATLVRKVDKRIEIQTNP